MKANRRNGTKRTGNRRIVVNRTENRLTGGGLVAGDQRTGELGEGGH